ncbi:MAG: antibiotic biosynthesis monooxygenase [Rhodospirillum sp.]|nr:antibiotic biosynthesis monooxygenase [Rhodospirillum sp.]MCF8489058.1 antibiotic biosynthesis monooxygenase [Rhodospirillum sp.]MCF8499753.1 antibiotic biosynthesis monooxygenase [Rhodospirillum sp.]
MFIAMNRFRIRKGGEETFETIWRERESHLERVPGFIAFHLLKGPEGEDHTLYATHTQWENRSDFEAWTQSEAFRKAHANAGAASTREIYLGPPQFEGFEALLEQRR